MRLKQKAKDTALEKDMKFIEKIKNMTEKAIDDRKLDQFPTKRPFKKFENIYEKEH